MVKILEVWKTAQQFHAAMADSNDTISGGYHDILRRAEEQYGTIDYIRRDGELIKWSQRFC